MNPKEIERLYFRDRKSYENLFYGSPIFKALEIMADIAIVLRLMNEDIDGFYQAKKDMIWFIKTERDPSAWRGVDGFEINFILNKFLINYLSRNQSQIDINRRLENHLKSNDLYKFSIKSAKDELINLDEVVFLKDLRNFLQHYSIPKVDWVQELDFEEASEYFAFTIDKNKLLKSECFNAKSKQYLTSQKKIEIDRIVLKSIHSIFEFYGKCFYLIFSSNKPLIHEYLFFNVTKKQIVKNLRNESFSLNSDDVKALTSEYYDQFLNFFLNIQKNIKEIGFELTGLTKYICV